MRTLANMVERLGETFDFRIVTQDRDVEDRVAYSGIDPVGWNPLGHAHVRYLSRRQITLRSLVLIIREVAPDVIYLNSFFDPLFTQRVLLLRRFKRLGRVHVVLAPRGEFSQSALALKAWKKRHYLRLSRWLGLYRGVRWQASSDLEKQDILENLGHVQGANVMLALNLAARNMPEMNRPRTRQPHDPLRVCFLSRIAPMKNLDFAIFCLGHVRKNVVLTIYGPREDREYWGRCEGMFASLPCNVEVTYAGEVPHQDVISALSHHDLFFLPTRGENYGHVIHEALAAGLPVLISDRTPWQDLEQHRVGWALSLEGPAAFAHIIDVVASWSEDQLQSTRQKAVAYARSKVDDAEVLRSNRKLFIVEGGGRQ